MHHRPPQLFTSTALVVALSSLTSACGDKSPGPAPTSSAPGPSASAAPVAPPGPPSPLSVALESSQPITLSGLAGGVWIGHAARARAAQAIRGGELVEGELPKGLPDGPGRIVRAAGRLPGSLWLSFEEQREDGKPGATPLYRLTRGELKKIADDWLPHIAPWSKNRILSASTSSGRLKVKVLEPQLAKPPADVPGTRLDDAGCARTLKLRELAALPSGEVFGAGSCTPEGAKGTRYVVIRWTSPDAGADAGAGTDAGAGAGADAGAGAGADAGADADAGAGAGAGAGTDAGAGAEPEPDIGVPGLVSVVPGPPGNVTHRALHARSATEVYAAAVDEGRGASYLARFDGAAWSVEPLPAVTSPIRALSGTADGTLWMITEREIWRRGASGGWELVPPPSQAFPEPEARWELLSVWAGGGDEAWIAARHTSTSASRYVVLRSRDPRERSPDPRQQPAASIVRWP